MGRERMDQMSAAPSLLQQIKTKIAGKGGLGSGSVEKAKQSIQDRNKTNEKALKEAN
jgi:hypothetical protein